MSSSSEENNFLQQHQRRQRETWLNRLGKEFHTCWLPLLDVCHIVADYLIHFPHQFGVENNSEVVTVSKNNLSVKFKKVCDGVMTKWPLWKTSPTIHFLITDILGIGWMGLRELDSCTNTVARWWLISNGGYIIAHHLGDAVMNFNPNLKFQTGDVMTIECDFDQQAVYFQKNNSDKHLVFQHVANLQDLHFYLQADAMQITIC